MLCLLDGWISVVLHLPIFLPRDFSCCSVGCSIGYHFAIRSIGSPVARFRDSCPSTWSWSSSSFLALASWFARQERGWLLGVFDPGVCRIGGDAGLSELVRAFGSVWVILVLVFGSCCGVPCRFC